MSVTTIGALLKEKFNNFVVFCNTNFQLTEDAVKALKRVNGLNECLLVATLGEMCEKVADAIQQQDIDAMVLALANESFGVMLSPLVDTLKKSDVEVQGKFWRYLQCFQELSNSSKNSEEQ